MIRTVMLGLAMVLALPDAAQAQAPLAAEGCLGCHGLEVLSEDAAAAVARHPRSGASIVSRVVGGAGGLVSRHGG